MTERNIEDVRRVTAHLELLRQMAEQGCSPEEAMPACNEAMEVVGPLAEQIGLKHEQHEMLDLAVRLGYPDDYERLRRLLLESEAMCENVFKSFALPLCSMMDSLGIEYTFLHRMKSVYSIWRKMRVDHKEFDDVYDLFAARIVYKVPTDKGFETLNADLPIEQESQVAVAREAMASSVDLEKLWCWRIYNIISSLYRIHPDRIKDWVTHPKPSGYQAVQLTVMGPDCNWIEIQIRSERMDYEAEHGSANHFLYKQEKAVK